MAHVDLHYFGALSDLNLPSKLSFTPPLALSELKQKIIQEAGVSAEALLSQDIQCALNQTLSQPEAVINDSAEVAFFPPVTGG